MQELAGFHSYTLAAQLFRVERVAVVVEVETMKTKDVIKGGGGAVG